MREEFEKWLTKGKISSVTERKADYEGLQGWNEYRSTHIAAMWEAWQASRKQALDAAIAECEKLATLAEEDATLENDERFLVYAKKYRRCSEAIRALQKE